MIEGKLAESEAEHADRRIDDRSRARAVTSMKRSPDALTSRTATRREKRPSGSGADTHSISTVAPSVAAIFRKSRPARQAARAFSLSWFPLGLVFLGIVVTDRSHRAAMPNRILAHSMQK